VNINSIPVSDLPFTKLYQDYLKTSEKLAPFFETNPFDENDVKKNIESCSFHGNRKQTVEFLKEYNHQFDAKDEVFTSIDKLLDNQTLVVVTGQQLTLYGGPLFTIYKILTAIIYAKRWEKKFNRPVIPVFWMADEDHDYEEAAIIGIPGKEDFQKLFFESDNRQEKRVFDIGLGERIESFFENIKSHQFETDFSDDLWKDLQSFYHRETTFGKAFGKWILHLFGKHGLILAGTNHNKAKEIVKDSLQKSVENVSDIFDALSKTSNELKKAGYHQQVFVQPSNLFWIDDDGNRQKLHYEDEFWSVDSKSFRWSSSDLINDINNHPDRFSPNVFLRPVTQNFLLPAAAYVAGPGEIAYYAQTKEFYGLFGLNMPIILPRFSATILESGIDRILKKLPFNINDYNQRIEDLEAAYIEQADTPDIEKIFGKWRHQIDEVSKPAIAEIGEIETTLKKTSEKAKAVFYTELEKLKGKLYRSVKDQEKTQLDRIRKIQAGIFPEGNLQEREVAFIYFMNKYGPDIWDQFLEALSDDLPDSHKIIRL
jgi:bacillithiol synthase